MRQVKEGAEPVCFAWFSSVSSARTKRRKRSTRAFMRQRVKDREEKDGQCLDVRNREKGLLAVSVWCCSLEKGTFRFSVLKGEKKKGDFFFLFRPRSLGYKINPVKATAVVSFSPNKGLGPAGS